MLIVGEMKLSDIIHHDYTLVPVINRFDIQLGFGDITIEEICKTKKINLGFFLTILNTFHDPQYFPMEYLKSFPAIVLIKYLRKAHKSYLEEKIPEIKKMIARLSELSSGNKKTLNLISNFFNEYSKEFGSHIEREENVVYPYVLKLESNIDNSGNDKSMLEEMDLYSISNYEQDHEDIEEKLFDLKNLLIKYLHVETDESRMFEDTSYLLLRELFVLEKELREHSRIEDLILVPKVEEMEELIKARA